MILIKIIAIITAWLLFYNLLKSRKKRLPKLKATIITLLFAALIFRVSMDLYARIDRAFFSFSAQGKIQLQLSPLKIPNDEDAANYCKQFTDQYQRVIHVITERGGISYCGTFWQFPHQPDMTLPYKNLNSTQVIYWASPSLQIMGSRQELEKCMKIHQGRK